MRLVLLGLLLIFLSGMTYQTRNHPQIRYNKLLDRIQHPFDTRLRYRIAEVDSRFGLTEHELKQISQQATDIWKDGTGQDYFVYDPQARLSIHLIYDQRQNDSVQRRQQFGQIQQRQQLWASKNQQLKQFKDELDHANTMLEARKTQLDLQLQQYNQHITIINQNGGIPAAQRAQMTQQQSQLQQQIFVLQQEINIYNQKIQQLNFQVDELNQLNLQIDSSVQSFNQRFQPRLFDKGSFNGQQINIYEFESQDDLRLTLAHEFGHALELKHNQDPQALMYPLMKEQNLQNFRLSTADIALLQAH
ncbi:matrixin family metalloprotease [Acinetobacter sp.]|uniref:matrixin family metalloprotease n=1 Tax=Acinetobacter sp. TaxID=472 RepID=UPI00264A186C|nr:matrixin family metalloprotease [Acinetobacter sp.]MDN5512926.1 matrixin family metalloprotease [Acinetobacter sp.]MDN5525354.1 matrixin family metalloprotease [Acinetobacter sp.]